MIWSHPIETYWNNYWKWDWKVPGQAFLVLNLLTLRSIHSLGSYPWGPWSALSMSLRRQHGEKCRWKTCFHWGEDHQHSNQVESKSWRSRKLWSWHCSSCPATSEVFWGCVVINRKPVNSKNSADFTCLYMIGWKSPHIQGKNITFQPVTTTLLKMLLSLPTEVWEPSLQQGLPSENLIQGTR